MATFRSYSNILGATRTNTTITKPSGLAVDDIMFLCLDLENDVDPTPPAGFVPLRHVDHTTSAFDQWIYWKRATATDVAASNFTTTHASTWSAGVLCAVSGASTTAVPKASTEAQGSGTSYTANAVTAQAADAWVGLFITTFGGPGFITPPTGTTPTFTEHLDVNDNIYFASGTLAAAGSTGTKSATGGSQPWISTLVVMEDDAYTSPYPGVVATAQEVGTNLGSANAQPLPSGAASGDLVLYIAANDNTSATNLTGSTGWTAGIVQGSTGMKSQVFARVLDGTTGNNILSVTGATQDYAVVGLRITNHTLTNSDLSTWFSTYVAATTGASGNVDPPNLTVTSDDYLWIAVAAIDAGAAGDTITVDPTGYDELLALKSAASNSSVILRVARKQATAASDNPGTFTNTSRAWHGWTLAVPQDIAASTFTGTIAQTLGSVTQNAAGSVADPVDTGTVAQTLPLVTQNVAGTSSSSGTVPTIEFSLTNPSPVDPADPRYVHIRAAVTAGTGDLTFAIREGGSTVQSWTVDLDTTITTFERQLTNAVTNYDDLTLQITGAVDTGGAKVRVYWTELQVPSTGATVHNGTIDQTLGAITQAASGTVADPAYTAAASSSLSAVSQSATAQWTDPSDIATVDSTLQPITQSAVAQWTDPVDTGVVNSLLQLPAQAAVGTATAPSFDAAVSQSLEGIAVDASGGTGSPGESVILVAETFTRTHLSDLAGVHPEIGNDVFVAVGTWRVESNEAVPVAGNESHLVIPVGQSTGLTVSADVLVGTNDGGLALFAAAGDNRMFLNYYGVDDSITLYRLEPGPTYTPLVTDTYVPSDSFTLSADITEDFWVIAKVNGVELFRHQLSSADQAAFGSVQSFGLRGWSGASKFDNLTISTLDVFATASASSTLPLLSQAAVGTHETPVVSGAIDQTLQLVGQSATGATERPTYTGTAASLLQAIQHSATATHDDPDFVASAASTLQPVAQTASAQWSDPVDLGVVNSLLSEISQNAAGTFEKTYTATSASSLQAVAQSAVGTVAVPVYTGAANSTIAAITQSATGTTERPVGVAAIFSDLPSVDQAVSGAITDPVDTGIVNSLLPTISQTAVGDFEKTYTGSAASTLQSVDQAASGTHAAPSFAGITASTLDAVTQSASGTISDPVDTGITHSLLSGITQAAVGSTEVPAFTAAASSVLSGVSQAATGTVELPVGEGFATSTLQAVSQAASGSVTAPVFTATASSTLPSIYQTTTALEEAPTFTATAASTLQGISQSVTAHTPATATVASTLQPIAQIVVGDVSVPVYTASADSGLSALVQAAQGLHTPILITGTAASVLLPALQQAIAAHALLSDWLQAIYTVYTVPPPITVEILSSTEPAIVIYKSEVETELTVTTPDDEIIYVGIPVD